MGNSQSDGINTLKRIEFEFKDKSYKFILNPEEYTQTETSKVTVTQTKSGGFADDFGAGLTTILLNGTTGFKKGSEVIGFKKFEELRDMLRSYREKVPPGTEVTTSNELLFYNYTDGEYWVVTDPVMVLRRSIQRPLLYQYSITMTCLRRADQPSTKGSSNLRGDLPPINA